MDGLLAYMLVSKFDDHLPLYRLSEIFARMGADIPDSTLVKWCGRAMRVLQPLIERIEAEIMSNDLLHADDTPIRVSLTSGTAICTTAPHTERDPKFWSRNEL